MKVILRLFKIGCLVFIVAAGIAIWLLWGAVIPADQKGTRKPVVVEIPEGATGAQIALLLQEKELIPSELAFRLMIRYTDKGGAIRSGHYEIDPSRSPLQILDKLVQGETLQRKATLPEGLTLAQVAEVLEKQKICSAAEFLEVARTRGEEFGEIFPANLEGYLFPDTYNFPWEATPEEAVRVMTEHFKEIAVPLWSEKAPLDLRQSVILASLVEREAQVPSERPLIAGVYLNRLEDGMLLQCDATVQYALGKPRAILTHADLEIESPYNTYRNPGLPPGPICNPGKASLEAAMRPRKSDYLFYVRNDVKGDGSHVFTRNYTEHQRAIERYQR